MQASDTEQPIRAYLEYFRDLGVHDFYRRDVVWDGSVATPAEMRPNLASDVGTAMEDESPDGIAENPAATPALVPVDREPVRVERAVFSGPAAAVELPSPSAMVPEPLDLKAISFAKLALLPEIRVAPEEREDALRVLQAEIGDCTRCPLAYGGRHSIVFGDGNPRARLMFVGEGPGADEDASGVPFVGKAGQLLNNMITAMGLRREDVYIANIVKCRPPANRVPEPVEAGTCSQFLVRQIDIVQPEIIVALGATAATYLLGVKQSLGSLRGQWYAARGAKVAVTYHPAFLLRDPRQKGEAWKDLQRVMAEMGLKNSAR
jgi:uracil-DNA glycosylase family 4